MKLGKKLSVDSDDQGCKDSTMYGNLRLALLF